MWGKKNEKKNIVFVKNIDAKTFIEMLNLKITFKEELPKVDVIVTSPPYNLGVKYEGYNDRLNDDEYLTMLVESFIGTDKICNDDAIMYINLKEGSTNALKRRLLYTKFLKAIEDMTDWKYVQRIVWFMPNKQQINPNVNKRTFSVYTEDIFFFAKEDYFESKQPLLNKANIGLELSKEYLNDKRYKTSRDRMIRNYGKLFKDIGDLWSIPILKYNKSLKKHNPAEFPMTLPELAIKSHRDFGVRTLTVLDMFAGGGTTMIAALRNNCNVYGCDISKIYYDIIVERIRGEFDERMVTFY